MRVPLLMVASLAAQSPLWAAPAAAPSPGDVAGLALWLDAADAGTVILGGAGVKEWRDRSGKGRHVGQPDAALRPQVSKAKQNGRPLLSFDGATQFLTGPAALPAGQASYTLVAVWRPRQNAIQSVFEQAATPLAGNTRAAILAVGEKYGFNGESNDCHGLVPFAPNAWRLTFLDVDNAQEKNIRLWDNGVLYAGATEKPKALSLGAGGIAVGRKLATDGEYLDGEVGEILVYDRALTRAERIQVLVYLDGKWGLDTLGWFRTPEGGVLAFDFEGEDYEGWKVEGTAFGTAPAKGTLPGQMDVAGHLGEGLVNSYIGADGSTGTLTSPAFLIDRKYIRFLIGGGKYPEQACINLVVDGKVARTATGPNDKPGGSERLDWAEWSVAGLVGKTATIRIVDQATAGWGHINIDHIFQTDEKLPVLSDQSREMTAEKRYLNLPVRNGAAKRRMRVLVGEKAERDFVIPLADGKPDYWTFMDLAPFKGKKITLEVEKLPEESHALARIEQGDAIKGGEDLYRERLRPQFHFTTRRGWNNDPNGLVYHAGEWHLFYQHNPYSIQWDNMHWGHAVSTDLVHWQELPVALYPDPLGPCFSGSAVVDEGNTAGFGKGAIVCIFTAAGNPCVQSIAYSTDRGRTWANYEKNPVLGQIIGGNRDPKVIWYAPERKWVMALFLDGSDFGLFSSPDLKTWERMSTVSIPGTSECPEFFEIPVQGKAGETRWIFYGGNGRYLVGRFDGKTFTAESGPHAMHHGNCFYASQTFNGAPDGRRVLIPWGTVGMPGMPFNQMMGFPVELTLRQTEEGLRLSVNPVREVEKLYGKKHSPAPMAIPEGETPLPGIQGDLFDIRANLVPGEAAQVGLLVRGVPVTYDAQKGTLAALGATVPLKPVEGRVSLRILVDRVSMEIFANDGSVTMPMGANFAADKRGIALFARGGAACAGKVEVAELRSAWK